MVVSDVVHSSARGLPRASRRALLWGAVAVTLAAGLAAPGVAAARKGPSNKSVTLHAGTMTLKFTPAVFAALTKSTTGTFAATRTVTPVAPGASTSSGVFMFPLTSGKVNVKQLTGKVSSKGGIDFVSMSTLSILGTTTSQFDLMRFVLHLGGSQAMLSATFVGSSTSPTQIATLSTKGVKHSKHGKAVTITGVTLKLAPQGAQLLNNQDNVFKVGQVIGTASVVSTK